MKLLLSIDSIMEFRPIAKTIGKDRIEPYLKEAQKYELKQLLGDPLFTDFMAKFDQSGDVMYTPYQELLNGKSYAYGSTTIEHPGLIAFLAYHTLARFYTNNQISATRFGLVQKQSDQSEQLDPKAVQAAVAELRSNALSEQADIIKFLTTNGTTYPLYNFQDGSALGQTGAKFFDPDLTSRSSNGRTLTSW